MPVPMETISNVGMVIRQREPVNLESPFDQLDGFLTPNHLFYIRSHFKAPHLERSPYRLEIDGAVETPLSLSYEELRRMPAEKQVATLECAGNGRVFLVPAKEGAQWQLGAVGNAEWTGVPLRGLLERAGLAEDATEIVCEGADRGTPKEQPFPPEPIAYARSLRRVKALSPEVLVAYEMNGQELPTDHGSPVRLIVPGHYGMASVKWLTRLRAIRGTFGGYWQTSDYAYWREMDGHPVRVPLAEMAVKSQIARPRMYEVVAAGREYPVYGACWSGEAEVCRIEISTDGGDSWTAAEFVDAPQRYAWRRWRYRWQVPEQAGRYQLKARATDTEGRRQPNEHNPNTGSYIIHHALGIEVVVESATAGQR